MKTARIVVAAAASGAGKTSFTVGLLGALAARGISPAAFKVGPDYLDTGLHAAVTGRPSRNLDPFLMGKKALLRTLAKATEGLDLAVIEGVMGYLDGMECGSSTSCVALLTASPVLLLVDASASAESAGAVALGFVRARRPNLIRGVVLNRIAGPEHYQAARHAVERLSGIPVLGFLPSDPVLALPERHLGLLSPADNPGFAASAAALAEAVESHVDIDTVIAIAQRARRLPGGRLPGGRRSPPAPKPSLAPFGRPEGRLPVAIARDEAFSFYYEDNFDAMRATGLEPVFFSPMRDRGLPAGIAGLYLGGGYPELHAEPLSTNLGMKESLRKAASAKLPILAECGGWLYLLDSFEDGEGRRWPMCGILSGKAIMGKRLADLGYRETRTPMASILGPAGTVLRGHVFHFARTEGADAGVQGNIYASWLHMHFAGNPAALAGFALSCQAWAASSRGLREI